MGGIMRELKRILNNETPIKVAIIGIGLMGSGLISQINEMKGIIVRLVSSRDIDNLKQKLAYIGISKDKYKAVDRVDAIEPDDQLYITDNNRLAWELDEIDCIVDCTGNTKAGAEIAYYGITHGKHIVSLNVETEVTIGLYLKELAQKHKVVYTGTAGDEPGAIMELVDFADLLGFDILAVGKGKNNPLDHRATPEKLREKAIKKGLNPRMLTSFVDATNTMIELNAVANAIGFVPDIPGCHGITANHRELADKLLLKEEGGILNQYGIVDYVHGIAPGVFIIVRPRSKVIDGEMKFLNMGKGPNYTIYRPYHLTNIETPISIARAVLKNQETIAPRGIYAQTITIAKRDIKTGEKLEGIGSRTVYGIIEEYDMAKAKDAVPIGLITEETIATSPIKKGSIITMDQVELEESSLLAKLYKRQFNLKS